MFAQITQENNDQVDSIHKKTKNCAEKGTLAVQQWQKDLEEDNTREENIVATRQTLLKMLNILKVWASQEKTKAGNLH